MDFEDVREADVGAGRYLFIVLCVSLVLFSRYLLLLSFGS